MTLCIYCALISIPSTDGRFEWDEDKSFWWSLSPWDVWWNPFSLYRNPVRGLAELQDFIILYLSYTEPASGRTRIISARPAEPIEEREYYEWRKNFIAWTDSRNKGFQEYRFFRLPNTDRRGAQKTTAPASRIFQTKKISRTYSSWCRCLTLLLLLGYNDYIWGLNYVEKINHSEF